MIRNGGSYNEHLCFIEYVEQVGGKEIKHEAC